MDRKKKYFIITVDTEGDNLWNWKDGDEVRTENVKYIKRFEEMCKKYNYKPVYLSNWEVLKNNEFVDYIKEEEAIGNCEVGMHIHAWNNPPFYKLDVKYKDNQPYLIEYPTTIMENKIDNYLELYKNIFAKLPTSHRAGRWAMNKEYFDILRKKGISVDCSFTPYVNWSKTKGQTTFSRGSNYSKVSNKILEINGIKEMPVTIMKRHNFCLHRIKGFKELLIELYNFVFGRTVWLRPNGNNLDDMKWIIKKNINNDSDYIMFMIHSSELMAGGSPNFRNDIEIEKLYKDIEEVFSCISKHFIGITLKEYITK